jgi:hypothetical protein
VNIYQTGKQKVGAFNYCKWKCQTKRKTNEKCISTPTHTLNLDRVVFIGRTFSEYMRTFNLEPSQLKGLKIPDVLLVLHHLLHKHIMNMVSRQSLDVMFYTTRQELTTIDS